jgi:hypothetical protein
MRSDDTLGSSAALIPLGSLNDVFRKATAYSDSETVSAYDGTAVTIPEWSSLNASYAKYRIVSVHVSVEFIHNNFQNQGTVALKMFNPSENNVLFEPTLYSSYAMEEKYGVSKQNFSLFPNPIDDLYRHYTTIGGASDNSDDFAVKSWPSLFLFYVGCQTDTNVAQVTVTRKLELLGEPGDFTSRMGRVPPPANASVMQHVAHVRRSLATSNKTIQSTGRAVASAADAVAHVAPHVAKALKASKSLWGQFLGDVEEGVEAMADGAAAAV